MRVGVSAPLADIDFRVGVKWGANDNKDGTLGDANLLRIQYVAMTSDARSR